MTHLYMADAEPHPDDVAALIEDDAPKTKWCQGCGDWLTGAFGETTTHCRWCDMDATDDGSEPDDED